MLVWLSACISYQLNIVSDYAITQYRTNASEIAHLVRIVCSDLNMFNRCALKLQYRHYSLAQVSLLDCGNHRNAAISLVAALALVVFAFPGLPTIVRIAVIFHPARSCRAGSGHGPPLGGPPR